ncbi:unnamed protein product [Bursaphelenchus okinawaensis]|uniref:Uncharacterized protein n=1 Tax=Bursaphelenchus okinawaensis TaxID=465554 RepID=A0A811KFZ4_9BILA|nr:unnamed protein product [Bursaphelenchus okinawaensis]CAG9102422.1 unnamed protein product [Bursaphelenchus okinawaensis]
MLGAQALRTKQKVEQKEREKRHKERQRNLEAQRERIQKAASEDAQQQMLEYMAQQQRLQLNEEEQNRKIQQRLSLHANALSEHLVPMNGRESKIGNTPRRSPSTDCATTLKVNGDSGSSGNRLMRWLGFNNKKPRRMSTFT